MKAGTELVFLSPLSCSSMEAVAMIYHIHARLVTLVINLYHQWTTLSLTQGTVTCIGVPGCRGKMDGGSKGLQGLNQECVASGWV